MAPDDLSEHEQQVYGDFGDDQAVIEAWNRTREIAEARRGSWNERETDMRNEYSEDELQGMADRLKEILAEEAVKLMRARELRAGGRRRVAPLLG
jgi:hypothetical protein